MHKCFPVDTMLAWLFPPFLVTEDWEWGHSILHMRYRFDACKQAGHPTHAFHFAGVCLKRIV